jgi:hypothetical protein
VEKLLHQTKCIVEHDISHWVFEGMRFSKNINGWTVNKPSIELTFLSNICIIPDRLLPSRACFRLYRCGNDNEIYSTIECKAKKHTKKRLHRLKKDYFCKFKTELKKNVKLYQDLIINCKLFLGRVTCSVEKVIEHVGGKLLTQA